MHPISGFSRHSTIGVYKPLTSSRCFAFIQNWVEQKIRRHLARARYRGGFGWKQWSREWLYGTLGLFKEYRVAYRGSDSAVVPV